MNTSRPSPSPVLSLLIAGACIALFGCKSDQYEADEATPPAASAHAAKRAEISNEFTATAEVTAVDPESRVVTLRREDGSLIALEVDPSARNLDQLAVGDTVRVRYKEALAASLRPAGESARGVEGMVEAGRTEAGAKPGGGVGLGMSARVKLESIDMKHDIVVFSLASGELIAHRFATPAGREFVEGLKVGDVVQLDYAKGMALTVEEL